MTEIFDIWKLMELLAMASGFIYVIFEVKKSRRMWRWMIISSVINGIVYIHSGFTAMTLMQLYYIITAIYGIRQWAKVKAEAIKQHGEDDREHGDTKIAIVPFGIKRGLVSGAIALAVFALFSYVLTRGYTPAEGDIPGKPYWDSAVAVLSMLATYWLSRSWFAQWYVWLVVNVAAIVMFLYPVFTGHTENALVGIGILYVAYLVTCIIGIINWKKHGVRVE